MPKILFIDVDGTLVGGKDHKPYIPQSAIDAIRETRKQGNLVYLCTGRALPELYDYILDIGFDGIIGSAGGYLIVGNQLLFHHKISKEDLLEIENYFNNNGILYYLESNSGLFGSESFKKYLVDFYFGGVEPTGSDFYDLIQLLTDQYDRSDVNKISWVSTKLSYEEVEDYFKDRFSIVRASWAGFPESSGELALKGISKKTAIEYLLDYLHIDQEDTYCFGDSMNDIEMFNACKYKIAMGNSKHGLEQYATFVTKDLLDDGLAYSFEHYHLI